MFLLASSQQMLDLSTPIASLAGFQNNVMRIKFSRVSARDVPNHPLLRQVATKQESWRYPKWIKTREVGTLSYHEANIGKGDQARGIRIFLPPTLPWGFPFPSERQR